MSENKTKEIDLNSLTIEEKVAQMLMFAFHGTEYENNEQLDFLINELHVGGIIHFARNIINPTQACILNYQMQRDSNIPLFIGLDQEGGTVQRVVKGVTPFPGAMALAATNENTEELCYYVGKDLKSMNYNMVFAPVADVNNNPLNPVINSRSYSDNPLIVADYVDYAVKGFQKALVLPTIKHFPGHGDTSVDSHISLPVVKKNHAQLKKTELVPFEQAIKNGVDGVMVSHILYPAYDDLYPATLSYNIMTKYLKEELNYQGMIVSDSLTMGAINNNYSKEQIVALAVNGGMDLLIFCGRATIDEQKEIYNAFVNGVKNGVISEKRVDESVKKILKFKSKYCNDFNPEYSSPSLDAINLGTDLSEKSITLVKTNNILPLVSGDKVLVIFPKIKVITLVDDEENKYSSLGPLLNKDIENVIVDEIIIDEAISVTNEIKLKIKDYTKIIMATYNVRENDYQTKVFSVLDKEKTIVVSMRSPYDYNFLDGVKNYICIYEPTELALNSLVKVLTGKKKFMGKLPIKLD